LFLQTHKNAVRFNLKDEFNQERQHNNAYTDHGVPAIQLTVFARVGIQENFITIVRKNQQVIDDNEWQKESERDGDKKIECYNVENGQRNDDWHPAVGKIPDYKQ
jgi:hypothetical protein